MLAAESALSISFTASLSEYGGDIAVGAMTIITSVCQLVTMPLQGICQGGQPIISYNYGAHNDDRVKEAFQTQFIVCIIFSTLCWGAMLLIPQVFAVFLAEPISDIIAAIVTTTAFFSQFNKILRKAT